MFENSYKKVKVVSIILFIIEAIFGAVLIGLGIILLINNPSGSVDAGSFSNASGVNPLSLFNTTYLSLGVSLIIAGTGIIIAGLFRAWFRYAYGQMAEDVAVIKDQQWDFRDKLEDPHYLPAISRDLHNLCVIYADKEDQKYHPAADKKTATVDPKDVPIIKDVAPEAEKKTAKKVPVDERIKAEHKKIMTSVEATLKEAGASNREIVDFLTEINHDNLKNVNVNEIADIGAGATSLPLGADLTAMNADPVLSEKVIMERRIIQALRNREWNADQIKGFVSKVFAAKA